MLTKRFTLAVLLLTTAFSSVSHATGFIATPSTLDTYRQEVGILSIETDLEAQKAGFPDLTLKQRAAYLQVEMPVLEIASLYVRAGAADAHLEADSSGSFGVPTLETNYQPWGGVGIKGVIGDHPYVNLGYYAEGSYFSRAKDTVSGVEFELNNYWDVSAALLVQLQYQEFGIYVGPCGHVAGAKLEVDNRTTISSGYYRGEGQGVQAGVKIPLGSLAYLTLDGQFGDRSVWGGSLNFVGLDF